MSTARSDRAFLVMLAVTVALVAAVFIGNSRDALHPELKGAPRIDVERVVERIEDAGLEPVEAKYYIVIE
jgi:hypothetical protein